MCEPVSITMAVTAALGLAQQAAQSKEDQRYQNKLTLQRDQKIAVNTTLANRAAADEQKQVNNQVVNNDVAASQKLQATQTDALQATAKATVAKGEAGVSGVSVNDLMADYSRTEAVFIDSVKGNQDVFTQGAEARKLNIDFKRRGRIASVQPYIQQPVKGPDWAGAIGKVGTAYANSGGFDDMFSSDHGTFDNDSPTFGYSGGNPGL